METFVALLGFSFVSTITPGPNNILLWASGAAFGVRRTLPHIAGTAFGIGMMALVVAAAETLVLGVLPELTTAMKLGGTAYLVYLAWQVTRLGALERAAVGRPFGVLAAAGFQVLNPKAWIFSLGAVTTFRPSALPGLLGGGVVALTMMAVIVPTALAWAAGGAGLERFVTDAGRRRVVSLGLAALLLLTIVLVWT